MLEVPAYPKIFTLGATGTADALNGPVVVQEKVDGSFFGFGKNERGELVARSRGKAIDLDKPDKMFGAAVEFLRSSVYLQSLEPDVYFFAEYLQRPKHNVLTYGRVPENHLALFDAFVAGRLVSERRRLEMFASLLGVDLVPELGFGRFTVDDLQRLHATPSFLGKELVEGVVVKNYGRMLDIYGQYMPLYTKFVRDAFKERHTIEWTTGGHAPKASIQDYVRGLTDSVRSEARWRKAVLRGKEESRLEGSPKDIGWLCKYVAGDMVDEERENVKRELWAFVEKDVRKSANRGLAEWYKAQLVEDEHDDQVAEFDAHSHGFAPEGCDEVAA